MAGFWAPSLVSEGHWQCLVPCCHPSASLFSPLPSSTSIHLSILPYFTQSFMQILITLCPYCCISIHSSTLPYFTQLFMQILITLCPYCCISIHSIHSRSTLPHFTQLFMQILTLCPHCCVCDCGEQHIHFLDKTQTLQKSIVPITHKPITQSKFFIQHTDKAHTR